MNILDENILADQRESIKRWRISVRQIGYDIGRAGMQDEEIIPLLHQLSHPTFFTRDLDFYQRRFCYAQHCIVYLSVEACEVAVVVRKLLRHSAFKTVAKRMGMVIRAAPAGLVVWMLNAQQEAFVSWNT